MQSLGDGSSTGSAGKIEVELDRSLPSQSMRGQGKPVSLIISSLEKSGPWAHYAAFQFAQMLAREQELHGRYICLYHSYSHAALLYEVHTEVARTFLGASAECPPLPRLSLAESGACSNLEALRERGGRDHDAAFRALGLSSSCSLFASGSEAPPLSCFQGGYSCTDLDFRKVLIDFLKVCSGNRSVDKVVDSLIEIGERYLLPVSCYKGGLRQARAQNLQLTGYMLQVFIDRSVAEEYAYPSLPYGVPIKGGLLGYLDKPKVADGQARILFHPPTFLDEHKVQLFHYCARPLQSCLAGNIPLSRGALIREMRECLAPLFRGLLAKDVTRRLKWN